MSNLCTYIFCLLGFLVACFLLFYGWKALVWVISQLRYFRRETGLGKMIFMVIGLFILGFIGSLGGRIVAWIFDLETGAVAFLGAVILPGIVLFNAWTKK